MKPIEQEQANDIVRNKLSEWLKNDGNNISGNYFKWMLIDVLLTYTQWRACNRFHSLWQKICFKLIYPAIIWIIRKTI
jgi:hypothetical protein